MSTRSPFSLARIVEGMGRLSPSRHRELVRGMAAELDSIASPSERTRFALGAILAIARLVLSCFSQTAVLALGRIVGIREAEGGANPGGPSMTTPTTWPLLRRFILPFALSLTALTLLLLGHQAARQVPEMSARGVPAAVRVELLLLALPHILALTIPMAVFLAVAWVFTRLGAEGALASARRERHGMRRLITPVVGAAALVATFALVSNTQVLPRTNARILTVLQGAPGTVTDRTMTIGELREAAGIARGEPGAAAAARAAAYEVEIQKKLALAAACLVLALVGAAIPLRFPRGGLGLVVGAGIFVFTGYWLSLMAGESLADRLVIPPVIAMWLANAFLLAVVLLLAWRRDRPDPADGVEVLAIGG